MSFQNNVKKYLPFLSGTYSTAPGLISMEKSAGIDSFIFQIDDLYNKYFDNKISCRNENIKKYYHEYKVLPLTMQLATNFIADRLCKEFPLIFELQANNQTQTFTNKKANKIFSWKNNILVNNNEYLSVFDALCSQVQEDVAVCQLTNEGDYLSAIHLCSPNHWDPADKIGNSFITVHDNVPGMGKTLHHHSKMLQAIINKPSLTRFAWGISSDARLNHHPVLPPDYSEIEWKGRNIVDKKNLFVRTEHQNLVGFPQANAFLFTIRTYFYEVDELNEQEQEALWKAVKTMSPETLEYKGLTTLATLL